MKHNKYLYREIDRFKKRQQRIIQQSTRTRIKYSDVFFAKLGSSKKQNQGNDETNPEARGIPGFSP
jgi:hypothetical protein